MSEEKHLGLGMGILDLCPPECVSCPTRGGVHSSVPGVNSLDARAPTPTVMTKNASRHCQCPQMAKAPPGENR